MTATPAYPILADLPPARPSSPQHLTVLTHLVWSAGPTAATVSLVGTGVLWFYRIDRRRHAEIVEALHSRRRAGV
jgi:Na+/melibiose symporter-like transporter